MLVLTDWSSGSSHTFEVLGSPKEQEMEADKRALTLDVQQQHQRLILHQALSFGRLVRRGVSQEIPAA